MDWATLPLRKYAVFTGRARRKEFWLFTLLSVVIGGIVGIVETMLGIGGVFGYYGPLTAILILAFLVPSVAVGIRRLHDTDRSGWWILVGLGPFVGGIVMLVLYALKGTDGANRFGPDPLAFDDAGSAVI